MRKEEDKSRDLNETSWLRPESGYLNFTFIPVDSNLVPGQLKERLGKAFFLYVWEGGKSVIVFGIANIDVSITGPMW